jgi:hypothetical protein
MPNYIVKSGYGVDGGGASNDCCREVYCKDNTKFYMFLAQKLLEMTESVNNRIKDIEKNCNRNSGEHGVLLVSIDAPAMVVNVKYEYIEYIKRYGPPPQGKFDEHKLHCLREELGIDDHAYHI